MKGGIFLAFLFALYPLAWLGCTSPSPPGIVEGIVSWQGEPVPAALVEAYLKPDRDPSTPAAAQAFSDSQGRFRMELAAGEYWIWARAQTAGSGRTLRLIGQAEQTPVRVAGGDRVRVSVPLAPPAAAGRGTQPTGAGVVGRVRTGEPHKVTVYAYRGDHQRPTGPGFAASAAPDEDGRFRLDLTPGVYTVVARWRETARDFGALGRNDRIAIRQVEVNAGRYTDLGDLTLRALDAERWEEAQGRPAATPTRVRGTLRDPQGQPAAGLWVLAFDDPRMSGRPLARSGASDPAGRFELFLPGGGRYYLGARSRVGGPAEPGERVGAHRGVTGSGLEVAPGEMLDDLEIVVEELW